jgi:hypothetical protein
VDAIGIFESVDEESFVGFSLQASSVFERPFDLFGVIIIELVKTLFWLEASVDDTGDEWSPFMFGFKQMLVVLLKDWDLSGFSWLSCS